MSGIDIEAIKDRIIECCKEAGQSESAVSVKAAGNRAAIMNMKRGSAPSIELVGKIADALEVAPEYLIFGKARKTPALPLAARGMVPVTMRVAAGTWIEVDDLGEFHPRETVPVPADPAYPADWQFAVEVDGESLNKIAPDGSVLSCIDVRKARVRPRPGEVVIVERMRADGREIERTAKVYRIGRDGGDELWPESTDPRWQEPVRMDTDDGDETVTVRIIGIARWQHASVQSTERSARL